MPGWSIRELLDALARYREQLVRGGLRGPDADAYLNGTKQFLRWLGADPGIAGGTIAPGPKPNRSGPGSEALPATLRTLVEGWIRDGCPGQKAAPWPRERWIGSFPAEAEYLRGLPSPIDRDDLKVAAADAHRDAATAERAFITVMAWGYGKVGYGPFRTERALATPNAAGRLCRVAQELHESGAVGAYALLGSATEARLNGLGPAFGTKFLTFAQAPEALPRALILDETVASWLDEQGIRLNPNVWSVHTYERYLRLMHGWAQELAVSPDDLEFVIFREMARRRGTQWAE